MTRKLWLLLVYGSLAQSAEHGRLELEHLRREAETTDGMLGGLAAAERAVADAKERHAFLSERLPHGTPNDWVAAGSRPLFDEYERKVREIGHRFDTVLDGTDARRLRLQLEAICARTAPPFRVEQVPEFTADPDDNPIIYGALLARADFLVSDDKHIVPGGEPHEYEHEDRSLLALTFNDLASQRMPAITWDEIDGSLLAQAMGTLEP